MFFLFARHNRSTALQRRRKNFPVLSMFLVTKTPLGKCCVSLFKQEKKNVNTLPLFRCYLTEIFYLHLQSNFKYCCLLDVKLSSFSQQLIPVAILLRFSPLVAICSWQGKIFEIPF
ncbi:hypothetical protein KFK09_006008 [Dendrobium nobile]|uniref:Uncharacterized protein n=1 Tax=Dendrobium nobile TaxID=94219 RepID=A0A8T3BZV3_DENNO|nr:hypothetical protein KFK09_006008 [Dendrobium nobile]